MRLGAYPCVLEDGSLAHRTYGKRKISERHRHRYEFNNKYREQIEQKGMVSLRVLSGPRARRDRRGSRPSVVLGMPVSSRVQVTVLRLSPVVQGIHQGCDAGPSEGDIAWSAAWSAVGGKALRAGRARCPWTSVVESRPGGDRGRRPLRIDRGACVIEGRDSALRHAQAIRNITARLGVPFIYKSSYDKANRTSIERRTGASDAMRDWRCLAEVRREIGVPVLTDVHEREDVAAVAAVVDVLQTPALLCRQTDFLQAWRAPASR